MKFIARMFVFSSLPFIIFACTSPKYETLPDNPQTQQSSNDNQQPNADQQTQQSSNDNQQPNGDQLFGAN